MSFTIEKDFFIQKKSTKKKKNNLIAYRPDEETRERLQKIILEKGISAQKLVNSMVVHCLNEMEKV
jgi:hypothetical protein